ncbi:PHP domain-containing protein [Aeromicrobium sp.]|uniref:PHP domain-containing protein n=1 Tax=Aeromicrobium sp. TaxID=1871063 RepID=UPI003C488FF6
MKIDLHTHSNRSDGTDSPADLVENAKAAGLDVVAITDHDSTEGWKEADRAAKRVGITLVHGIEISTRLEGRSIHLLGYEFDSHDRALLTELRRILDGRDDRMPKIVERLNHEGIDISEDEVRHKARNARASGRPHIADVLVDKAVVKDRGEAFSRFLMPGRPGYVEKYAVDLPTAIGLIKSAGGTAVIAHPWSRGSDRVLTRARITELAGLGLDGIEVDHNDHDSESRARLRQIAREVGLIQTGSSDYHGSGKGPEFSLGCNTTPADQYHRLMSR